MPKTAQKPARQAKAKSSGANSGASSGVKRSAASGATNAAANMGDKEYMQDILLTSKTLAGMYHYATQESCTAPLHNAFKSNLNGTLDMQNKIFGTMQQCGWYPMQQAQKTQIDGVKTKFKNA